MAFRVNRFARGAMLLAFPAITLSEAPVLGPPKECGGVKTVDIGFEDQLLPQPRYFRIGSSGLCSEYTSYGWEKPMNLHLGEGASEHLPMIRRAVDLWNRALMGFNRDSVIRIETNERPENYTLDNGFWENGPSSVSRELVDDGQSVIYFKASGPGSRSAGYAHRRWNPSARTMVEADAYINTYWAEEYGVTYYTQEVYRMDEDMAVFARVDDLFLTILHEIGHMLGLAHVPVSGNIMSYNYMPRMIEIWAPVIALRDRFSPIEWEDRGMVSDPSDLNAWYSLDLTTERGRYLKPLIEMYTNTATLGEQDKVALMCVYDFKDWNH